MISLCQQQDLLPPPHRLPRFISDNPDMPLFDGCEGSAARNQGGEGMMLLRKIHEEKGDVLKGRRDDKTRTGLNVYDVKSFYRRKILHLLILF